MIRLSTIRAWRNASLRAPFRWLTAGIGSVAVACSTVAVGTGEPADQNNYSAEIDAGSEPDGASSSAPDVDAAPDPLPDSGKGQPSGQITYTLDNEVFRIRPALGSSPENVSAMITRSVSRQPDRRLNTSPNGQFYIFETGNVDCTGVSCLAIAPSANPSAAELVREGGNPIENAESLSVVSNDGNVVVYAAAGITHLRDLFMTRRILGGWSLAQSMTDASPFDWNDFPSIHSDGMRVLFDCGMMPGAENSRNICEVDVHGSGFRVVVSEEDAPPNIVNLGPLHHAHYAPDGSIVFGAAWDGERIWRKRAPYLTAISMQVFNGDNSPCVLPDGRIVSLWTGGVQNPSHYHEIKVMSGNGESPQLLLTGRDVSDVGLGCGN